MGAFEGGRDAGTESNKRNVIACIGPDSSFSREEHELFTSTNAEKVDYYKEPSPAQKGVRKRYIFSSIGSEDKTSHAYEGCTGIVVVGRDKGTGETISLLTHHDPRSVRADGTFLVVLKARLTEFQSRVDPDSIDVVIFGGDLRPDLIQPHALTHRIYHYRDTIKRLGSTAEDILKVKAHVIIGPLKTAGDSLSVYFNTKERRLYLRRPIQYGADPYDEVGFPYTDVAKYT